MADIPRPILNKIPGGGMPIARQENHVKDVMKLTRIELLDIKAREEKLLANKAKLNRLPDKGQRIQQFYDRIVQELQRRANVAEAAALFSELNIASKGENMLNQFEWSHGANVNGDATDPSEDVLDSDDEIEMDPLRIIAQKNMHERKMKVLPPEPTLITPKDLEEIQSFNHAIENSDKDSSSDAVEAVEADIVTIDVVEKLPALKTHIKQIKEYRKMPFISNSLSSGSRCSTPEQEQELEQHVRYLVGKEELQNLQSIREKFKPYKTTVSNVHDPEKEKQRKKGKYWEVTAATPPMIQHSGAKLVNLMDSVQLQINYLAKLKESQEKQAAERLAARIERLQARKLQLPSKELLESNTAFTSYRSTVNEIEGKQHIKESEEIYDPLDEEKPGGFINYTVYE